MTSSSYQNTRNFTQQSSLSNSPQNQTTIAFPQRIYSAYNFVPAPEKVVYPDWADFVSMDRPFQDGLSGELKLVLENETPLFIKGKNQTNGSNEHHFYRDGLNRIAIPGTSLRGMLRSVLEIASFSKLNPLNDIRYGIRDLKAPHLYNNFVSAIQKRADIPKTDTLPLVNAGWLTKNPGDDNNPYMIEVCDFARVEYNTLKILANQKENYTFNPDNKQSAKKKYDSFPWVIEKNHHPKNPETISLKVVEFLPIGVTSSKAGTRVSSYGEASLVKGISKAGKLVFTGQPQQRTTDPMNKAKHHDFFFYPQWNPKKILVSREQFKDFEFIHADGAEQHKDSIDGNEEWGFWKKKLEKGYQVPVFFTLNANDQLKSFGLAMMFRFAYELSTGDLLMRTQTNFDDKKQDFAELLFGYSAHDKNHKKKLNLQFLKGRVSVSQANLISAHPQIDPMISAVFGGPKPSFYPNYIQQGKFPGDRPPINNQQTSTSYLWNSYNQDYSSKLRGWKRYITRNEKIAHPPMPEKANDKLIVKIHPLSKHQKFEFKIRFHNLRQVELGALLWAIEFGGIKTAFHSLGMGKNLGLGRVKLTINQDESYVIPNDDQMVLSTTTGYMKRFQAYMLEQTKGDWASSNTIKELIACATPFPDKTDPAFIEQPKLSNPIGKPKNDFIRYKENGLPLPLHSAHQLYQTYQQQNAITFAQKPAEKPSVYAFDWNTLIGDQGQATGTSVVIQEESITEVKQEPLPEKILVSFVDFTKAREFRKNYDERKAKGKEIKYQILDIKTMLGNTDSRLSKLMIDTEKIKGLEELLNKIKNSNSSFFFTVKLAPEVGISGYAIVLEYIV